MEVLGIGSWVASLIKETEPCQNALDRQKDLEDHGSAMENASEVVVAVATHSLEHRQAVNVSVEIITIMDDMAPDQTSARVVVEVTPPRHVEGVGAFRFTQVEGDAVNGTSPNCENECHCKALPCLYLTGTCTDGCAIGWRGDSCNERDCSIANGGCQHQCTEDKTDEWCSCYKGSNISPDDWRKCVNCSNNNGGCEHNCIDDATEKWCSCREGSEVSKGDWRNCDDVNECNGERGVDYNQDCHHCINEDPGYSCNCDDGYKEENTTEATGNCVDINECEIGVRGVDYDVDCQICINTKGNYTCGCYEGYELHPNAKLCIDVDECERELYDVDCHTCVNFIGGHTCLCNDTYVLDINSNNETCIDMNAAKGNTGRMTGTTGVAVGLVLFFILAAISSVVIFILVKQRKENTSNSKLISSKDDLSVIHGISGNHDDGKEEHVTMTTDPPRVTMEAEEMDTIASAKQKAQPKHENVIQEEIYVNTSNNHFIAINQLKQFVNDIEADEQSLLQEFKSIPKPKAETKYASDPALKSKQRFANILPYDHNRVKLEKIEGQPLSDYINASHVQGTNGRKYIASQGPRAKSLTDFWRMIWEQKVERIAMLTNLVEIGNNKCTQYWPEKVNGPPMVSDQFTVKLLKEDAWPDFTRRQMEVSKKGSNSVRPVTQYHYTTWPDHGVPSHATALWRLFRKLTQDADNTQPIIIHCSAGVGRTGTLIAMDHLLDQANKENGVDVYACVTALRQSRMHMVQTVDQYKFIHLAVLEAHTVGSTCSSAAQFMSHYSALNRQSSVSTKTVFSEQTEILSSIGQSLSEEETGVARLAENSTKNRTGILPANRHLLFLQMPFNGRSDYINAVQVPGYKGTENFIATQWPLEDTVVDFWRLVKDHDIQHIVLLEQLSLQNDFPKILPESGQTENFGEIRVHCKEIEQNDTIVSYTVQFIEKLEEVVYMNTNTEETNFTEQNINVVVLKKPLSNQSIIDVRSKLGLNFSSTSTNCAVVCTDGAKLCGLFIAGHIILDMVDAENEVDVFYGVQQIKVVRPEFVQSQEQFLQLYDLVKAYLKQKIKS